MIRKFTLQFLRGNSPPEARHSKLFGRRHTGTIITCSAVRWRPAPQRRPRIGDALCGARAPGRVSIRQPNSRDSRARQRQDRTHAHLHGPGLFSGRLHAVLSSAPFQRRSALWGRSTGGRTPSIALHTRHGRGALVGASAKLEGPRRRGFNSVHASARRPFTASAPTANPACITIMVTMP